MSDLSSSGGLPDWAKALIATSFVSIIFATIHLADDVVRNEFAMFGAQSLTGVFAFFLEIILVAGLYGLSLIWRQKARGGYVIITLLSIYIAIIGLTHTFGGVDVSLADIGKMTGVFFVWVVVAMVVSSISALILSLYGLFGIQKKS